MNELIYRSVIDKIKQANSIILTTHKQCDGDGLGSLLGLYHALKTTNKEVRALTVDGIPKKYNFLKPYDYIEVFEQPHRAIEATDLIIIFDTNDRRLVEPLYSKLKQNSKNIIFIDHHPLLKKGDQPTVGSYINEKAASTGEITYRVINDLEIPLNPQIAQAIYTSIVFDTQLFRYIRNSPTSHLICADLLKYVDDCETVHRSLFATFSPSKITFLAQAFKHIEYHGENQEIAFLKINQKDLDDNNLDIDDSRDIIDMIMNINSVKMAVFFREEGHGYKASFRSLGEVCVQDSAEKLGGGGHRNAAGAFFEEDFETVKQKVIAELETKLKNKKHA